VKTGRYSNASEVVREDPDNVRDAVLAGLRSIERGEGTQLQTENDLRRYFEDIVHCGKKRLAAGRRAARG
jgi:hypothetical protein